MIIIAPGTITTVGVSGNELKFLFFVILGGIIVPVVPVALVLVVAPPMIIIAPGTITTVGVSGN
jgi:hypothetical protein